MPSALLNQARSGQKRLVEDDRQLLTMSIESDPDDPWAVPETESFYGRISHRAGSAPFAGPTPAGVDDDLRHFLSVTHDVDCLVEGATITDESGVKWDVGKPDPLRRFGGVYGYQADLTEVS